MVRRVENLVTHKEETLTKAIWEAIYLDQEQEELGVRVQESKPIFATYSFVTLDILISLNLIFLSIQLGNDSYLIRSL